MGTGRRVAVGVLAGLAALVLVAVGAILAATNTPWGREQLRGFVVERANLALEGELSISRIEGNLLQEMSLVGLSLVDREGRPFLVAERARVGYALLPLLRQRVILTGMDLHQVHLVLDRPPEEAWNFERIFGLDPDAEPDPDPAPGLGDWIEIRNVRIEDSRVTLRTPWVPDDDLSPNAREEALGRARAGETREVVEEVPGGLQQVMDLQAVESELSRVMVAHPDSADLVAEVQAMRARAHLIRTPPAAVDHLAGRFRVGGSTIAVEELELELPNSTLSGDATFDTDTRAGRVTLTARPVALHDLRFLREDLPEAVEGDLELTGEIGSDVTRVRVEALDVRIGEGHLQGQAAVHLEGTLATVESDLRFAGIDTRFLQDHLPGVRLERHGTLEGHLRTAQAGDPVGAEAQPIQVDALLRFDPEAGAFSRLRAEGVVIPSSEPRDLRVAGLRVEVDPLHGNAIRSVLPNARDVGSITGFALLEGTLLGPLHVESALTIRHPDAGPSRLEATGGVSVRDGLAFQGLEVALAPVELQVIEALTGELPVGGSVDARGVLDGRLDRGLAFHARIQHEDGADASRLEARGQVRTGGEGHLRVGLDLDPVSLVTAGRFVPEAGLQGNLSGFVHAEGSLRDLRFRTDLGLPGDGGLSGTGTLTVTGDEPAYAAELHMSGVDLAAVSARVEPRTAISGTVSLSGEGTEPGSARGQLTAELVDDHESGEWRFLADLAADAGLLQVHRFALETEGARARAEGAFGLSPEREGSLAYEVVVDSLGALDRFLPDTGEGTVEPRPAVHQAASDQRRRELEGAARAARVQYLATGERPPLPQAADTLLLLGVRRDARAGALGARGEVRGNPERVEADGDLVLEGLLVGGHRADRVEADYTTRGLGGPEPVAWVDLRGEGLVVAGFGYERARLEVDYQGQASGEPGTRNAPDRSPRHSATLSVAVDQDPDTRIRSDLSVEAGEGVATVRLEEVSLELVDALYRTTGPATLRWSQEGLEIRELHAEGTFDTATLSADAPSPVPDAPIPSPVAPTASPDASIRVDGYLPREGDGSLDVRIDGLEVAHLLTLAQARNRVAGRIHLDLPVRGSLARPVFQADALLEEVFMDGDRLPDVRASLGYRELALEGEAGVLSAETGELTLRAEGGAPVDLSFTDAGETRLLDGPIRLDIRADSLDLSILSTLSDQVESAAGRADAELTVAGTFDQPDFAGSLTLEMPGLFLVPLGVSIRDVAASVTLEDEVIRVDSLVAYSRGPMRVGGEVVFPWREAPTFHLEVEARNLQAMDTRDVQMRVDADLQITGPFDQVEVGGDVRARRGVVRIPETEELAAPGPLDLQDPATFVRVDPGLVALRDALIDSSPLMENLRVDLSVFIDRDVWVRSAEANIEVFTPPAVGPLRVRMNGLGPRNLTMEGTIHTGRGEYAFMGRRFDLARGTVIFGPEDTLDPFIRLTAEHEVQMPGREAFDIRIIVDGTLAELDTELESTAQPPLSQTDLLSLVVFGREAGSLLQSQGSGLSGQGSSAGPLVGAAAAQAAQRFATVGIEALVSEAEAEVARALGLDVLHIQPAELPAEISSGELVEVLRGTEVEAGAYVTPRLFISGHARPTFVHPGARIEYQTNHGWTWRATWRPRFLPAVPTLSEVEPDRASVLGMIILREWRF